MTETPLFGFRLLPGNASEAAKTTANNENALLFEALFKQQVISRTTSVPPGSPAEGDVYIVSDPASSPAASGAWAGHGNEVAIFYNGWLFALPVEGPRFWVLDESVFVTYDALSPAAWTALGGVNNAIHDNVPGEIAALTLKAAAVAGDHVLIEDSEDSNNKKRAAWPGGGNLGGARMGLGSDFSVATGANRQIDWDTEEYDTDSYHNTAADEEQIVIPAAGKYDFTWEWQTLALNNATVQLFITLNGTAFADRIAYEHNTTASGSFQAGGSLHVQGLTLAASDVLRCYMFTTVSTSLEDLTTSFAITRIE